MEEPGLPYVLHLWPTLQRILLQLRVGLIQCPEHPASFHSRRKVSYLLWPDLRYVFDAQPYYLDRGYEHYSRWELRSSKIKAPESSFQRNCETHLLANFGHYWRWWDNGLICKPSEVKFGRTRHLRQSRWHQFMGLSHLIVGIWCSSEWQKHGTRRHVCFLCIHEWHWNEFPIPSRNRTAKLLNESRVFVSLGWLKSFEPWTHLIRRRWRIRK